jgi:hypothetical protein
MRFYATLVNIGPKQSPNSLSNRSTTNWHQPGVASQSFFSTPFGGGGEGASIPTHTLHLGYQAWASSCPWVGGVCVWRCVCLCGSSLGVPPYPLPWTFFHVLMLSLFSTLMNTCYLTLLLSPLPYILSCFIFLCRCSHFP